MSLKEVISNKDKRHKVIVTIGAIYNYAWGIIKIVVGIISLGLLYSLSGIDTLFVGISRHVYLKNIANKEKKAAIIISSFVIAIGLVYALYSLLLLFTEGEPKDYSIILAITIALFSFVELGIAIRNLCRKENKKNHFTKSYRILCFSITLFAMVNTQNAITLATNTQSNFSDGILGLIAGSIAALSGLYSLVKSLSK